MKSNIAIANKRTFESARRINHSLTAGIEKRALTWMAERAPRWMTSDGLTLLGLLAQIGAGVFYALSRYNHAALEGVIVCIVLNWFGDKEGNGYEFHLLAIALAVAIIVNGSGAASLDHLIIG